MGRKGKERQKSRKTVIHTPPSRKKKRRNRKGLYRGYGVGFVKELEAKGLRLQEVEADGNCFFRSLSVQLQGDEAAHRELRTKIVAYLKDHRHSFEPFVEDEEPWDDYVDRMAQDGEWAGHPELHAASLALQRNIQVHQSGQPVWQVTNWKEGEDSGPALVLSYHDGNHYNSLTKLDGGNSGVPCLVQEEEEAEIVTSKSQHHVPKPAASARKEQQDNVVHRVSVELIPEAEEERVVRLVLHFLPDTTSGTQNMSPKKKPRITVSGPIRRNKPCLCGSGLKYKNCCGAKNGDAKRRAKLEAGDDELETAVDDQLQLLHI